MVVYNWNGRSEQVKDRLGEDRHLLPCNLMLCQKLKEVTKSSEKGDERVSKQRSKFSNHTSAMAAYHVGNSVADRIGMRAVWADHLSLCDVQLNRKHLSASVCCKKREQHLPTSSRTWCRLCSSSSSSIGSLRSGLVSGSVVSPS